MSARAAWMSTVTPLVLGACATMAQEDVPAVLIESNTETHARIVSAVGAALGNSDVTLASDALTKDNLLFIEKKPARDATGQRLSGRDYGRPERFELLKQGERCVLVHTGTQKRYELEGIKCVEIKK